MSQEPLYTKEELLAIKYSLAPQELQQDIKNHHEYIESEQELLDLAKKQLLECLALRQKKKRVDMKNEDTIRYLQNKIIPHQERLIDGFKLRIELFSETSDTIEQLQLF